MALDLPARVALKAIPCVFLVAALICRAQEKPPSADSRSVIVADTEEVSLDLVIRDKKGRAVKDLTPADLKIFDDGSPVTISDLRMITAASDSEHLVSLLYDRLDSSAGRNARDITAKLLKLQPGIRIRYAVFGIKGRMRLLQQYTTDVQAISVAARVVTGDEQKGDPTDLDTRNEKAIVEQAQAATAPGQPAATSADDRLLAKTSLAALQDAQQIVQDQHARPALAGLLGLVRAQRELPGRKVIVYFARGWQADVNTKDLIRSIAGAANRAGVTIYTIDANALDPGTSQALITSIVSSRAGMGAASSAANPRSYGQGATNVMVTPGQKVMAAEQYGRFTNASSDASPLELLATQTGGQYIAASGNPKKPLQRMFEDMTVYYQASYVPPPHESDGQFRPVNVTAVRRGILVQARSGYFALPPTTGSGVRPFEAPLLKILEAATLPMELHFEAEVLRLGELGGADANSLVVEVPLKQIDLLGDPNTNLFSAHVSIVVQIKDSRGAVIEHFSEDVPRHGALDSMEQARAEVITMQRHFSAPAGDYTLETLVMDRNNGKAGGYRERFRIPEPNKGPDISDIVLVRRETPYNAESDPAEPLRFENSEVVPSLSDELRPESKTISLFFVLHPDPNGEPPLVELEVRRDGEPLMRGPLHLSRTTGGALPYFASISSASLEPGKYELAAILRQGGEVAERSVSFSIDGTKGASGAVNQGKAEARDSSPIAMNEPDAHSQQTRSPLVLTAADGKIPPLGAPQAEELIADARARTLGYVDSLPDFLCVEVTHRSVDTAGNGAWRHRDSFAELLRYHEKQEHRVTLEVNGRRSDLAREDLHGTITHGEFGGITDTVFRPEAKAEFHWKETAVLGNGVVQVFAYSVPGATSDFSVVDVSGRRAVSGFHGVVYVDEATHAVRRITLEADDLPADFVIRSTTFSVDYDYIAIASHEYLMPVSGTVVVHRGAHVTLLNEMEFRDYRKYSAQTSIEYK